ncbi:transcription termination factor Rho [Nostocoides sp. Soil756]|uniref:transcription termination factor Rho n=1 Tax=Nostocoides sp. Soil756 TaxID=1736399 RepID=UPI0006F4D7C1|nr:transcription termination factor Rho [Tetrasphaera sp. Soil756]KRE61267.1 transcription termination factor Rho [Tetrasphaera sp. Soil756]
MTDTTIEASAPAGQRRSGALTAMRLAELQGLASSMGISGIAKMRKGDLVAAIRARQNGDGVPASAARVESPAVRAERPAAEPAPAARPADDEQDAQAPRGAGRSRRSRSEQTRPEPQHGEQTRTEQDRTEQDSPARAEYSRQGRDEQQGRDRDRQQGRDDHQGRDEQPARERQRGRDDHQGRDEQPARERQQGRDEQQGRDRDRQQNRDGQQGNQGQDGQNRFADDDESGRGRRRRNRGRNRDKRRSQDAPVGGQAPVEGEPQIHEDDVLVPVAGILDILDSYAFVRTTGYLPGSSDIYVPIQMVKRHGLRKGDAVTGAIKAAREGEEPQQQSVGSRNSRQKYTPLARLDTVNAMSPDDARRRPEFGTLTPLYPQDRLRLETEQNLLTTRIIDLVAPIGKGQRGLIVAPAKAGKTMVMQSIANAITTNNPECHLMVVLVDERPEEVTDMQRAVKGEVISSTFDRPAEDHTTVAELAIERAKRLVEMGHDVVVLLDSITKLGRAYNLAAPASGRILSGGVDSAALYPPKKFFGAARNIENGGSLTILATALVETGSRMDEVIFEEFKGTGNMELKLDRQLANRRIFPAVDINNSGTRREEILLAPDELKIMWKLRRVLAALDSQQGIELLLDRLKKTRTNFEFLTQVQQTSSNKLDDDA